MTTDYTSLPEDLEPVLTAYGARRETMSVHISKRYVAISRAAHEALGKPAFIQLLFGAKSRMLAIRASEEGKPGARKLSPNGLAGSMQVQVELVIQSFSLPPTGPTRAHVLVPRLVEGALLIGPLPKTEVPA